MKKSLHCLIKGQIHFVILRSAKMRLTPNEMIQNGLLFNPLHGLQASTQNILNMKIWYANQPIANQNSNWIKGQF